MSHLQSVFGALSESNQQPHQQASQQNPSFCQPMQTKPMMNQQSNLCQTQQQPMQQPMQQSMQQPMQQPCNPYFPTNQMPTSMPCHNNNNPFMQPSMPAPAPTACYLPPNVLDQLRCLANSNSTPIFILPAGLTSSSNSSTSPCITPCFSPTCIPYPVPIYQFGTNTSSSENESCRCTSSSNINSSRNKSQSQDSSEPYSGGITWNAEQHICKEGAEGTVCTKKNCPASIQLQAMISQLLAYQGVIPSAITRILLKRVPGSSVSESVDEIMEKAMRCIRQQPKDGLLREACNSREVTKLLSLYLTSSTTLPRIIPVLTTVQLKCNVLKAAVENFVSSRLMEEQKNCGVESEDPLDRMLLELKPEDELRQMLAGLRERECEERVNVNFASCATQKRIAEARLAAVQKKIMMVETEMIRRRDSYGDRCGGLSNRTNSRQLSAIICGDPSPSGHYDSPDPFEDICVTSPKRLLLKPHVGSPETTYEKPSEDGDEPCRCDEEEGSDDPCKETEMTDDGDEEEVKVQQRVKEEEKEDGRKDDDLRGEEAAGNEGDGVGKVDSEVKDL